MKSRASSNRKIFDISHMKTKVGFVYYLDAPIHMKVAKNRRLMQALPLQEATQAGNDFRINQVTRHATDVMNIFIQEFSIQF